MQQFSGHGRFEVSIEQFPAERIEVTSLWKDRPIDGVTGPPRIRVKLTLDSGQTLELQGRLLPDGEPIISHGIDMKLLSRCLAEQRREDGELFLLQAADDDGNTELMMVEPERITEGPDEPVVVEGE